MTLFIWDASSYDGKISAAAMAQAKREGIVAFTHRLTRQGGALDPYAGYNLAQARDAGIELLGAYAVTYTSGGSQQDDLTVRYADQVVSWWRTWAGWFWQVDLEKWPSDPVPASVGVQEARELRAGTGRQVVLYGSKGQYGDQLAGWDGPLWNARYPSSAQAPFRDLYPGDSGSGWQTYSGQMPALWQYASSATIGGLTTCDVSAFRGTLDQLRALLTGSGVPTSTGGSTVSTAATEDIMNRTINGRRVADILGAADALARTTVPALADQVAELGAKLDTVLAAIKAIPAAGGGTAPLPTTGLTISLTGTATPAQ